MGWTRRQREVVLEQDSDGSPQDIPPVRGFNWGAFFLTWIWAWRNRSLNRITVILFVLCILPYLGFVSAVALAVYSGLTGNRRAWQAWENKEEPEQFVKRQKRWAVIG